MSVAIRVIPCLDVHDGRVVKGVNFLNLRDAGDPVELAAAYGAQGADELTFLDISASSEGRSTTHEMVRCTAETVAELAMHCWRRAGSRPSGACAPGRSTRS